MTITRLNSLLVQLGAHRLSRVYPVWQLARPVWPFSRRHRRFAEIQSALLEAVLQLPWPSYLRSVADPRSVRLQGTWQQAGRDTWIVPPDQPVAPLLQDLLARGSWHLYLAPSPLDPESLPDAFRSGPRELSEFVEAHSVPVLIHASPTNRSWRLVVEPSAVPKALAA